MMIPPSRVGGGARFELGAGSVQAQLLFLLVALAPALVLTSTWEAAEQLCDTCGVGACGSLATSAAALGGSGSGPLRPGEEEEEVASLLQGVGPRHGSLHILGKGVAAAAKAGTPVPTAAPPPETVVPWGKAWSYLSSVLGRLSSGLRVAPGRLQSGLLALSSRVSKAAGAAKTAAMSAKRGPGPGGTVMLMPLLGAFFVAAIACLAVVFFKRALDEESDSEKEGAGVAAAPRSSAGHRPPPWPFPLRRNGVPPSAGPGPSPLTTIASLTSLPSAWLSRRAVPGSSRQVHFGSPAPSSATVERRSSQGVSGLGVLGDALCRGGVEGSFAEDPSPVSLASPVQALKPVTGEANDPFMVRLRHEGQSTSPMQRQRAEESIGSADGPLPPLCRALVLQGREAHLEVPLPGLAEVAASGGEVHVLGPLGKRYLRAVVRQAQGGGRALDLSMTSPAERHVATVEPGIEPETLDICFASGERYGSLAPSGTPGVFLVRRPGRAAAAAVIAGDVGELRLTIAAGDDGRPLASAARGHRKLGGVDHLELRVQRGADTALVLSCVLAVALLL